MARKHRPKWQIKVDAYLFRSVDDPTTIMAQEIRIHEMQMDGIRTTPVYELREGSSGGDVTYQADRYIQELDKAEEQIRVSQARMKLINRLYCECFNTEEQEFIRLFWLDVPRDLRGQIWTRNRMVTDQVRWFICPDKRDRPSRDYYLWRKRIYDKWWSMLFGDMDKEA